MLSLSANRIGNFPILSPAPFDDLFPSCAYGGMWFLPWHLSLLGALAILHLIASCGSKQTLPWRMGGNVAAIVGGSPVYFLNNPTWNMACMRAPGGNLSW
jgi:hypothetical protein